MQKKTIHLTIGILATCCAIPLAYVGLKGLWGAESAEDALRKTAVEEPISASSLTDATAEIHLASGSGPDINRALRQLSTTKGGTVILGAAVFETREPIVLDRDNVELRGSGSLTIIRLAEKADCPVVIIGPIGTPPPRNVTNVRLKNLVVDGNRNNQNPRQEWGGICDNGSVSYIRNNALTIRGAHNAQIDNITARNARAGGVVLEKGCRQIYIENLEATDNNFDGLACYDTEDSYFYQLKLHKNLAAGISLDTNFNHNVLKNAVIQGNGSQGIFMRDSNHNDFKKIDISENGAQGIFIAQADTSADTRCTNNVFSDITVMDNRGVGLRVNDDSCTENMVRNSKFKGNQPGNVSTSKEQLVSLLKVENY